MPKGSFFKRVLKGSSAEPRQESPSRPVLPKEAPPNREPAPVEDRPDFAVPVVQNAVKVSSKASRAEYEPSPRIAAATVSTAAVNPHASAPSDLACFTNFAATPSKATLSSPAGDSPAAHAAQRFPTHLHEPSPSAVSVEPSEANYTSSTSSVGRIRHHAARDHKAALHATNDRLQKAIQSVAKKTASPTVSGALPNHAASPSGSTQGARAANQTALEALSVRGSAAALPSVSRAGNDAQSMNPSRLHRTQLDTRDQSAQPAHNLPNTLSEASVFSAESDDDADFLTDDNTADKATLAQ